MTQAITQRIQCQDSSAGGLSVIKATATKYHSQNKQNTAGVLYQLLQELHPADSTLPLRFHRGSPSSSIWGFSEWPSACSSCLLFQPLPLLLAVLFCLVTRSHIAQASLVLIAILQTQPSLCGSSQCSCDRCQELHPLSLFL